MEERGEEEGGGGGDLSDSNTSAGTAQRMSLVFRRLVRRPRLALLARQRARGLRFYRALAGTGTRNEKKRGEREKEKERVAICHVSRSSSRSFSSSTSTSKKLSLSKGLGHPARPLRRRPPRARQVRHGQDGRVRRPGRADRDGGSERGEFCLLSSAPRALILAPTREVALQAADVVSSLLSRFPLSSSSLSPRPSVAAFVGGLPLSADIARCRRPLAVVAATPGRARALASGGASKCSAASSAAVPALDLSGVSLLVLDEADALLSAPLAVDVSFLASACGCPGGGGGGGQRGRGRGGGGEEGGLRHPQVMAFSATLDAASEEAASRLMASGSPRRVDASPRRGPGARGRDALLPADRRIPREEERAEAKAKTITSSSPLRFLPPSRPSARATPPSSPPSPPRPSARLRSSSPRERARPRSPPRWRPRASPPSSSAARCRSRGGWRLSRRCARSRARVAVATDLGARGVDLERVNLVVNADGLPREWRRRGGGRGSAGGANEDAGSDDPDDGSRRRQRRAEGFRPLLSSRFLPPLPEGAATLAHRAGRAGRFGGRGACITLVSTDDEDDGGEGTGGEGGKGPAPIRVPGRARAAPARAHRARRAALGAAEAAAYVARRGL